MDQAVPAGAYRWQIGSDARPISPDELIVDFYGENSVRWSSQPSIFSEVRKAGNNVAVIGWYHPYCRLFGDNLTNCYWESASAVDSRRLGFRFDLLQQAMLSLAAVPILGRIVPGEVAVPASARESHLVGYQNLLSEAKKVAKDDSLGLILLHLPVPHQPNIYDRNRSALTTTASGSYLDSLALADRTLGELRTTMESAGVWDNTTVLVSSDHWFRKDNFLSGVRDIKTLAPEQQEILSDETIDHRVPFILKLAGQSEGAEFEPAFNTVLTHDLILAILHGDITKAADATNWITQHSTIAESPTTKGLR